MAVSRPFLLAVIGVMLLGATFLAAQNAREAGSDVAGTAPGQTPAADPSTPSEPALAPDEAIASAFSGDVDSARFRLELSLKAEDETGSLLVTGTTDDSAKEPQVELEVKADGPGIEARGGFVTTGGKAWFTQGSTAYPVPQPIWDGLTRSLPGGAQPLERLPFDPAKWVKDIEAEGGETIDGVETQQVSARVDTRAVVRDVLRLAQRQGAQQPAEQSVKRAQLDVWVGEKDRVLRRLSADVALALPGSGPVALALDLSLADVGRPQDIDAPTRVSRRPPAGELGDFMRTALEGSALATGGDPGLVAAGLRGADNPRLLKRALRRQRKAVLFFANPAGLDDQAVGRAVRAVERNTRAVVLSDLVVNVDRYGSLVEDLGVTQTPAVVVIDTRGEARLVEGYVDPASLVQVVTDAR